MYRQSKIAPLLLLYPTISRELLHSSQLLAKHVISFQLSSSDYGSSGSSSDFADPQKWQTQFAVNLQMLSLA